jgi:hypothetical protein
MLRAMNAPAHLAGTQALRFIIPGSVASVRGLSLLQARYPIRDNSDRRGSGFQRHDGEKFLTVGGDLVPATQADSLQSHFE